MNNNLENMEKHGQVDVIHTDFSKAFDRVYISLLMSKLSELRVSNALLKWLLSYLTDRK